MGKGSEEVQRVWSRGKGKKGGERAKGLNGKERE